MVSLAEWVDRVERRADQVDQLVARTLVQVTGTTRRLHPIADAVAREQALRGDFELALPGWSGAERDEIWARQP